MKKTVKLNRILRYSAAFLWTLTGLGLIGVAVWFREAEGATAGWLLTYSLSGLLSLVQAALTFSGRKIALVLPILTGVLSLVVVVSETAFLIDGTRFSYQYLIASAALLLLSALTLVTVTKKN